MGRLKVEPCSYRAGNSAHVSTPHLETSVKRRFGRARSRWSCLSPVVSVLRNSIGRFAAMTTYRAARMASCQQASAARCDAGGCGSLLLFVFAGEFVSVAQYDLPLAVFTAVSLGAAQGPRLRLITGVAGHVLHVDGVSEVIADERHDVLRGAIGGLDAGRGPVEQGADVVPAPFVTCLRTSSTGSVAGGCAIRPASSG